MGDVVCLAHASEGTEHDRTITPRGHSLARGTIRPRGAFPRARVRARTRKEAALLPYHVLKTLGYTGMLEAVPQLRRRVIFYRGQLREWLLTQLREHGPATLRALAERLAQVQRKDLSDKRVMDDLATYMAKILYNLKSGGLVIASRGKKGTEKLWQVAT